MIFESFKSVALLLLMAIPGFIIAKTHLVVKEQAVTFLSVFLLYVCQPFVTFNAFLKQDFDLNVLFNMLKIFLFIAFFIIIIALIGKLLTKFIFKKATIEDKRSISYAGAFGNMGYMAIPFLQLLFPGNSLVILYAASAITAFNLVSWSFGIYLLSGDKRNMNIKKAIFNPATISLLATLPFYILNINFVKYPLPGLQNLINLFATMMGPLAMILVGLEMSDISLKELVSDPKVYFSSFIKLCISPVLAFALISILSYFLDFTQITVNIITAAAVPSANNLLMFSNKLGRSAKTPTKMVVISTILSILTIPIALNVFT